jgi:hypothetical protein
VEAGATAGVAASARDISAGEGARMFTVVAGGGATTGVHASPFACSTWPAWQPPPGVPPAPAAVCPTAGTAASNAGHRIAAKMDLCRAPKPVRKEAAMDVI